jgi:hypothetical protein
MILFQSKIYSFFADKSYNYLVSVIFSKEITFFNAPNFLALSKEGTHASDINIDFIYVCSVIYSILSAPLK